MEINTYEVTIKGKYFIQAESYDNAEQLISRGIFPCDGLLVEDMVGFEIVDIVKEED